MSNLIGTRPRYGEQGYRVDDETGALIFPPRDDLYSRIDRLTALLEGVDKKLDILLGGGTLGS